MKAQILAKISNSLNPPLIKFDNYDIMFFISHNLPKLGLTLLNNEDYKVMTNCTQNLTSKDPTINLTITEKHGEENKENTGRDDARDDADNTKTWTTGKLKSKEKIVRCSSIFEVVFANCSWACRLERILPPFQEILTNTLIFRHCAKDGSARSPMPHAQGRIVSSSLIPVIIYPLVMNSLTVGPQPMYVSYFCTILYCIFQ